AAEQNRADRKNRGRNKESALRAWRAHVLTEDEFEIGEAIVAAHEHVVAEEHERGGVGERWCEDAKIDPLDAAAEGQVAEDERDQRRQQHAHHRGKGKAAERLAERRAKRKST